MYIGDVGRGRVVAAEAQRSDATGNDLRKDNARKNRAKPRRHVEDDATGGPIVREGAEEPPSRQVIGELDNVGCCPSPPSASRATERIFHRRRAAAVGQRTPPPKRLAAF